MLHMIPFTQKHFAFILSTCCLYVLWPRPSVENIWLNPSGWIWNLKACWIKISDIQHAQKKMMFVFHLCCRDKSGSQACSWEKACGFSRVRRHTFMFCIFLFNLNSAFPPNTEAYWVNWKLVEYSSTVFKYNFDIYNTKLEYFYSTSFECNNFIALVSESYLFSYFLDQDCTHKTDEQFMEYTYVLI